MTKQGTLFPTTMRMLGRAAVNEDKTEHGLARRTDPQTSKVAAAHVDAGELEMVVLHCLYKHGNKTAEEITTITGRAIDSITPRTAPLKRKKLIVPTEDRRAGVSGAKRIVWAITDLGREVVIRSFR